MHKYTIPSSKDNLSLALVILKRVSLKRTTKNKDCAWPTQSIEHILPFQKSTMQLTCNKTKFYSSGLTAEYPDHLGKQVTVGPSLQMTVVHKFL